MFLFLSTGYILITVKKLVDYYKLENILLLGLYDLRAFIIAVAFQAVGPDQWASNLGLK